MLREFKMIIAQRGRPKVLHPVRTEYGKQIRKAYEQGMIEEKRANIQQYEPRSDGVCNTITTVLKDNMVIAKILDRAETSENALKTRQDKTRQDKTRQDKTRQDKTRQVGSASSNGTGIYRDRE